MSGDKTTEFTEDTSDLKIGEELLGNTDLGTARIPRYAVPGISQRLDFIVPADSPLTLSEAEHDRHFLNINNTVAPIEMRLPDVNKVYADISAFRFGGLFCEFVVGSPNFDVSLTSLVAGDLRGIGPGSKVISSDTLFAGLSRSRSDEALVRIYKRGGLWVAWCSAGWRSNSGDDLTISFAPFSGVDRVITDADNGTPIWLSNVAPGTLTFQSDIATGVSTTVINGGTSAVAINFGGHTPIGDASIAGGQAATIIVGPVESGVNKRIFVASSS